MSRNDSDRNECADWQHPRQSGNSTEGPDVEDDEQKLPAEMREPLFRDRVRDQLGVGLKQWYVIETFLLALPYPIFVTVYFTFNVNEMAFLIVTLLYSLVAIYVGFLS